MNWRKATVTAMHIAVVLGMLAGTAVAGVYREVRDWAVSCSNGLACSLQYAADDTGAGMLRGIDFKRTADPDAPLSLIVRGDFSAFQEAGSEIDLVFSIDDETVASFAVEPAMLDEWASEIAIEEDDEGTLGMLVDAMKDSTRMELQMGSGESLDIPLSGVTAGLLVIDEAQDRLERTDALQATGTNPPRETAPAAEITALDQLPDEVRADFEDEMAVCGGLDTDRIAVGDGFRLERDNGLSLIGMPCGPGGAYNQPYALYALVGEVFRPLDIPVMAEDGPSTTVLAYNIDVNAQTGEMTAFFRGRGIGDCGGYDRWSLGEDGMRVTLTLVESRAKGECDGNFDDGPEAWPLVWPKE
jgi:hypothetical protein